jgi:transposase-like protein
VKKEQRLAAIGLRKSGKSISEIVREIGSSRGSVSVWVRDVVLTEDQMRCLASRSGSGQLIGSNANKDRALDKRLECQRIGREMVEGCDQEYAMGCMLFWAEGSKTKNSVIFTNCDEDMVAFFVRFMRRYFGCSDVDFTLKLNVYLDNGLSADDIERFWTKHLELPKECLRKSLFRRGDGKGGKYKYGVCTVGIYNTEIAQKIFGSIQELVGIERSKEFANLR